MEALRPLGMNIENLQSGKQMRKEEFNVAKDVKDNKKSFFKHISNKRKTKDNAGSVLNGGATLVTEDTGNAKILNAFFASVFTDTTRDQESLTGKMARQGGREEPTPW